MRRFFFGKPLCGSQRGRGAARDEMDADVFRYTDTSDAATAPRPRVEQHGREQRVRFPHVGLRLAGCLETKTKTQTSETKYNTLCCRCPGVRKSGAKRRQTTDDSPILTPASSHRLRGRRAECRLQVPPSPLLHVLSRGAWETIKGAPALEVLFPLLQVNRSSAPPLVRWTSRFCARRTK